MSLIDIIAVGSGSCLGGISRYLLSGLLDADRLKILPGGTLTVNLLGCLILGFLCGLMERHGYLQGWMRLFLTVGFCGGFTTFSTFINESYILTGQGHPAHALLYLVVSLVGGIFMLYVGYKLS